MLSNIERHNAQIREHFNILSRIVSRQIELVNNLIAEKRGDKLALNELASENEAIIDSMEVKIHNDVMNGIVLFAPRATDLREMISFYDMASYMERVGDQLLNMIRFINELDLDGELYESMQTRLSTQLNKASTMLQSAILAFVCGEADLARAIIGEDRDVDREHKAIIMDIPKIASTMHSSEQLMKDIVSLSGISYNIERIGDNATNIAEAAIFLTEGKNIKHMPLNQ